MPAAANDMRRLRSGVRKRATMRDDERGRIRAWSSTDRNRRQIMIRQDPEQRELEALLAIAPPLSGRRVLEVGIGDGRFTRRYAHLVASVVALDPDAKVVDALRENALPSNVNARAADFLVTPLPVFAFDLVLFAWSL